MNGLVFASVFAVLMYAPGINYWNKTWLFPWCALLVLSVVIGVSRIRPISIALALGYALASGVVAFAYTNGLYNLNAVGNSAYALISILSVTVIALATGRYTARTALGVSALFVAIGVIVKACLGYAVFDRGIFIGNPSMTGCLIACAVPLLLTKSYDAFDALSACGIVLTSCVAIFLLDASVPWIILSVVALAYVAQREKRTRPYIIVIGFLTVTICTIMYPFLRGIEFFNNSNRFGVWQLGLEHWTKGELSQQLFGFGLGTTQSMLPKWRGPAIDMWLWYHNDWLQAFIELGVVGFSLLLWATVDVVRKAWHQTGPYFSVICGIITWGVFNYPCRMAFPALFCAICVVQIVRPKLHKLHTS